MAEEIKKLPLIPFHKYDIGNITLTALISGYSKLTALCSTQHVVLPSSDPLLNISAKKAAEELRKRNIKSYNLITAYLKRIYDVNTYINAATEVFEAEALQAAKEADILLDSIRDDKEERKSFDYKGHRNVCGLNYRRDFAIADENSEAVARVLSAGAIPICYTNVPPGCMAFETDNPVNGCTSNPHDTRMTPGGSSGGEGALIAAQGSLFGIGTDLGGSIRIPSALNGIYGLKASRTCPLEGHVPAVYPSKENAGLLAIGPMCRYVEDAPLLFSPIVKVEEVVREHVYFVADYLAVEYNVDKMELDFGKDLLEIFVMFFYAYVQPHLDVLGLLNPKRKLSPFKEFFKILFQASDIAFTNLPIIYASNQSLPVETVAEAERQMKMIKKHVEDTLENNGILVFPGLPNTHYSTMLLLPRPVYTPPSSMDLAWPH
ncbi:unnamed protein product [Bursaphelenchus okinawaensis]|uniref:Amidase domain-containing protein n=1 Tax=Bursaphelenchus okinawaensis TaxID=465554 RepID=A0A811KBQ4_9BILA|nr:unnamed protein product [Bursaphelenchus okinawaensis]CAG9098222.1 unnamed protein product [Bursaphelenchus okinawaensis]